MANCTNPQLVLQNGLTKNGKKRFRFIGSIDKNKDFLTKHSFDSGNYDTLPCGRCIACRLHYARENANRCYFETKSHEHSYFITLTYSPEFVPYGSKGNLTLKPIDLNRFIRSLRDYYRYNYKISKIRYFACGEYGSDDHTHRPHYHLILWGAPINNLKFHSQNPRTGDQYFTSKTITDLWGKGWVIIGDCTWETSAYVARYIMKKQYGTGGSYYAFKGILPEFIRMSRMPGIGFDYFDKNYKEIYDKDQITIVTNKEVVYTKPPRYYDKRLEQFDPELFEQVKEHRRKMADNHKERLFALTDLHQFDYLDQENFILEKRVKKLIKPLHK